MRTKFIAGAVVALLAVGAGAVLVEAASSTNPPTRQTTTDEIDTKTLPSSSSGTQNPLVNPGAAGTQMGWHGYGASSDATVGQSGTSTPGSVTPGAEQIKGPASVSPTTAQVQTAAQARARLRKLGYSWISELPRPAMPIGRPSRARATPRCGCSSMRTAMLSTSTRPRRSSEEDGLGQLAAEQQIQERHPPISFAAGEIA